MAESLAAETSRLQGPIRCRNCTATNNLSIHRVKQKPTKWIPKGGLYDPKVHGQAVVVELVGGVCGFCRGVKEEVARG